MTISRHIIADITSTRPELFDDAEFILETLSLAAKEANAIVLQTSFHKFSPQGVTAILLLAESHISIHTWPEANKAAVDIYTCGSHTNPEKGLEVILERLESSPLNYQTISRIV